MARKTYEIQKMIDEANRILMTEYGSPESRKAVFDFVTSILHKTDNYAGFQYLPADKVPTGQLPGIHIEYLTTDHSNRFKDGIDQAFLNTDDSRRKIL